MTRRLAHLLILALILALPILPGFGPPANRPSFSGAPPVAAQEIQLPAVPPVVPADGQPAGSPNPASPVQPARPAATWVQAFRPTTLWSSEAPDATSQGVLPQWTSFRQLGPPVGTRLPAEYPGDGASRLPLRGWIDSADVGPTGPPNPEHELAAGGNVSPITGVQVPRRVNQAWPQGISAQYAALVDGDSGEVLWGRNAHGEVAPASLTKIITSLVALDHGRLNDRVTVSVDSRTMVESTVMGLTPGESLSLETLLFGLMLPSGNDAALAIAQHIAGSERAFADLMNAKAAQLGLVHSRFMNPHGLDADGHYSSPYDLATFSRVGMRDATFRRLAGTRRYDAEGYTLHNLNRLIGSYARADGVKVGYTDNAGRAIVASATHNSRRVFVTLIRSDNPTAEAQALLEWAFRSYVWP